MKFIASALVFTFLAFAPFTVAARDAANPIRMTPPAPKFTDAERHAELAKRRAAFAAKMADNSVLVMFAAEPKIYAKNVNYHYRQENNFYYLTALKQTGSTLVMRKANGRVSEVLYLPRRNPARETWDGKMYSNEDARRLSGIQQIIDASEQPAVLNSIAEKRDATIQNVYMVLPAGEGDETGLKEFDREHAFSKSLAGYKVMNAQPIFAELRLVKSPYEIKLLQHAVDITMEAQGRAMATIGRANYEYEVQAEVEYTFRRRNADYWGYPSIVGCGPNATTLHYVESQGEVKQGDLMLLDVGAEYENYTADVTRTFPVNGKFTKEQADIYQIVYDAQEAVAAAAKPGVPFMQLTSIAQNVIKDGLFKLGLTTEKDSAQFRIWFMHGLGHWLGMNVHDVGSYSTPLAPGMVFTNEPGIYIREDALDNLPDTPAMKEFKEKVRPAFEKYKNIGVRIEDDMLVTPTGVKWMTGELPRTIADIEKFMAAAPKHVQLSRRFDERTKNVFTAAMH
jgi:Xaa-Pro aminopeptidase